MASGTNKQADQVTGDIRRGYADAAGLYQGNVDAMVAASQAMIHGYQSVNAEMLAFGQSRMKETLDMTRRLAGCHSPELAWEVQMEFARNSFQAYADECRKLADMTGQVMNETFSPLAKRGGELETATSKAVAA